MLKISTRARQALPRLRAVRYAHSNSFLFTLASEVGVKLADKYVFAVGPGVEAVRFRLGLSSLYRMHPRIIELCEDPSVVWGHFRRFETDKYIEFPETVHKELTRKNGFIAFNLSKGESGETLMNLRRLVEHVASGEPLEEVSLDDIYAGYLAYKNTTQEELEIIAEQRTSESQPEGGQRFLEMINTFKKSGKTAPSFTDIELYYFLHCVDPGKLSNVSLIASNGLLINTRYARDKFQQLVALKRTAPTTEAFEEGMKAFENLMSNNAQDDRFLPYDLALESFKASPLIQKIYQEAPAHVIQNINGFCLKVTSHLLNNCAPDEALLTVLQFPDVYKKVPHFMTLLFSRKGHSIEVEELFIGKDDPLSLFNKVPNRDLARSVLTVASPSADMAVVGNVEQLRQKIAGVTLASKEPDQITEKTINTYLRVFGSPAIDLRRLDGSPLLFSCSDDNCKLQMSAMLECGFLHAKIKEAPYNYNNPGSLVGSVFHVIKETPLTADMMNRETRLSYFMPQGYEFPVLYPAHIGVSAT